MRVLLIVGKGPGWAEDVAEFEAMGVEHDVMGINEAALWLARPPKHAFSYCPTLVARIQRQRPEVETHAVLPGEADHCWKMKGDTSGSSSLMGVKVAIGPLGYDRVVLAGVPLSGDYYTNFFRHWQDCAHLLIGRVRSMSGNTRELLGYPDEEWLNEHIR